MNNQPLNGDQRRGGMLWPLIAIVCIGITLLVVVGAFIASRASQNADDADDKVSTSQLSQTDQSTSPDGPSYGAAPTCQSQGNCSGPENQSKGEGQPPTQGTITALSDNSISIRPSNGAAVQTFSVTSSTKIMKGTGSTTYNTLDLTVGQAVTVAPTLQDKTVADFIALDDTSRLNNVEE